jgi:xanthine dehydrogenase accessory factor
VTSRLELAGEAARLAATDTPFVWATVVRAERPTSAKPGDAALVHADGRIEGFVGGDCAESTVRQHALEVLASGETRLLQIAPDGDEGAAPPDVVRAHNPCLSGGTLEIFLEPSTPLPVVAVFGQAPIATALLRADRLFGLSVRSITGAVQLDGARAVVVASHGNDEEPILEAALAAGVPYVGLVASRRRGPAVLKSLAVDDDSRATVHTPAGLDIHARTPAQVALSILAEIVRELAEPVLDGLPPLPAQPDRVATDPVCGMTVAAVDASLHADTASGRIYFCGTGCRDAYLDNPVAYPAG